MGVARLDGQHWRPGRSLVGRLVDGITHGQQLLPVVEQGCVDRTRIPVGRQVECEGWHPCWGKTAEGKITNTLAILDWGLPAVKHDAASSVGNRAQHARPFEGSHLAEAHR